MKREKKAAERIVVYDPTLRDGTQAEDISFSVEDKVRIATRLDEVGINYEVDYDAKHFFDGFKGNSQYALVALTAAQDARMEPIVLCDTNGGTLPSEATEIIQLVDSISYKLLKDEET